MLNESLIEHKESMQKYFANKRLIHLNNLLTPKTVQNLQTYAKQASYKKEKMPLEYSYHIHQEQTLNTRLADIALFASALLQTPYYIQSAAILKIGWRDFSMLLDTQKEKKDTLQVVIDLTPTWNEKAHADLVIVDEETTPVQTSFGSCTFFMNKRMFFRYCNHYAQSKKKTYIVIKLSPKKTMKKK